MKNPLGLALPIVGLLFITFIACKVTVPSPPQYPALPPDIQRMLADRALSLAQLKQLRFRKDHYQQSTIYLRAADRDAISYTKQPEGTYAFLDGKLIMIDHQFTTAHDSVEAYSLQKLLATLGPPDANLAANSTIGFREYLYLDLGLMICGNQPEDYFEYAMVFPPMTLAEYKSLLWDDPSQNPQGPDR